MNHQESVVVYTLVTGKDNLHEGKISIAPVTQEPVKEHRELVEIINKFLLQEQSEGWLCYQSDVVMLKAGQSLPGREDFILHGELAGKHKSLHIQQDGAAWRVMRIVEGDGNDHEECLVKQQSYCISETKRAVYHVYWKYTDNNGYQPDSYRFVGFSS